MVATAPTVYGIETFLYDNHKDNSLCVATAPTVYGIETKGRYYEYIAPMINVATAPTVYGIETVFPTSLGFLDYMLQQHLPFTVLKHSIIDAAIVKSNV